MISFSGTPKGIVHCHQNVSNFSLSSTDGCKRMLMTNVGFHIGGFLIPLRSGILGNKVVYFVKEKCFTAQHCLDMVAKEKHKTKLKEKNVALFSPLLNIYPVRVHSQGCNPVCAIPWVQF